MGGFMAPGQWALIIFAVAFLLLVIFIGIFLMRLTQSLKIITFDVDTISRSSNEILGNANELLTDVNDKMKTLDPTVQAVADLSVTVSELNDTVQTVTSRFAASKLVRGFGATGMAASVAKTAMRKYSHKKSSKKETK